MATEEKCEFWFLVWSEYRDKAGTKGDILAVLTHWKRANERTTRK